MCSKKDLMDARRDMVAAMREAAESLRVLNDLQQGTGHNGR